jgi:hypothetical protein
MGEKLTAASFREAQERADQSQRDNASLKAQVSVLTKERDKLLGQLAAIEEASIVPVETPEWARPRTKKSKSHRATLCLLVTDTHFDENVDPDEIDGINCYNREIAELRLRRCFERTIILARQYLGGVKYDGVALFLGGDIFSGNIHEELARTNADTLFGSLLHWIGPMVAGVGMLADEFGRAFISGVPGNHGRSTRKPIAKQRAADNLDWLLYRLMQREMSSDTRLTWNVPQSADAHTQVYNCIGVGTRILRDDLRWVPAESLKAGDGVFGFDEDLGSGVGRGRTRRWRHARVIHSSIQTRPAVKLHLRNGETLTCTADHRWLCGTTYGNVTRWVRADDVKPGWTLRRYLRPWTDDESRDGGWLAAIFDGEGSLSIIPKKRAITLTVHQNEGLVADRIRRRLASRAPHSEGLQKRCIRFQIVGGLATQLSLIGSIRPDRLLPKAVQFLSDRGPSLEAIEDVAVVEVEHIGEAPIVVMGTDTETYFAEGYGSHNTRYLLTHGDQFRGGSGISGSMSPLLLGSHRKTRRQAAAGKPYDVMVLGHWHQNIFLPSRGLLVGGCLKGYDEYAYVSNFEPEPPQQALWITTPEHGITFSAPVLVSDRKQEKW